VFRALLAQRIRSRGPAFGFLARVLGAHVLDIIVFEIAGFERHCNPVHAGSGHSLSGWCRNASGSRRHEGATIRRCHMNLTDFIKARGGQAKDVQQTSPTEHPQRKSSCRTV
jgi:hypothetical protein